MPYAIEKHGRQWCVVKSDSGETMHCYDAKQDAKDYLAALYANVEDARSTMPDQMHYRMMHVRAVDTEAREVEGVAVPYGTRAQIIPGWYERFEKGDHRLSDDPVLYAQHGHMRGALPIGAITKGWDTDDGFHIRAHISQTPAGDEAYTLLRDGVVKGLSVGFLPGTSHDEHDGEETTTVRTGSTIAEVSVTAHPAYDNAKVSQVRDDHTGKDQQMGTTPEAPSLEGVATADEVGELRTAGDDLERRVAVLEQDPAGGDEAPQFRSSGQLLKALVAGDDNAALALRAADTTPPAVSGQAGAGFHNGANWIDRPLRFVQKRRVLLGLFDQGPLPDAGNTVEYPYVDTTAGTVAQQASEGADLSYMEVELASGSANVGTYGGYSRLTRQAIERSSESYLDAVLRYQAIQYAVATNAKTRSIFTGITAGKSLTPAGNTVEAWINAVIDAYVFISENSAGLTADFMVCAADVFKSIAGLTDNDGRPIFGIAGAGQAVNTLGQVNLAIPSLSISNLPVVLDPGMTAGTCRISSAGALTVLESPGAPFRLQDENVVALTEAFSLYGYAAWTVNDQNGVVKITTTNI